jgi:hypothetical protein
VTAPVSRFGQKFWVKTKYATAVAAPSTLAVDPARTRRPENEEQPIHPLYAYLYVADKYEGLILVNAATLLDGDPLNNYLKRARPAFNPDGVLANANNIAIAGVYAYITTDNALVVISINDPLNPRIERTIPFKHPKAIAIQFRYGFVVDDEGLKVINLAEMRAVENAFVPLEEAHDVYVARTYAYVANGKHGLAIVDVEQPEHPRLDLRYNADGQLDDVLGPFTITVKDTPTGSATLHWSAPETNEDGTPLTDLRGYRVYYGQQQSNLASRLDIPDAGITSATVEELPPATWYFSVRAYADDGTESGPSNILSKTID